MRPVKIGKRQLSADDPIFIIAEAGVNHNGDLALAKRLVEEAKRAGADCVKFQTFKAEEIVTHGAPKANYQLRSTDPTVSQLNMLKKLELPKEAFSKLIRHCKAMEIQFLSTPYSFHDIDLLDELGVEAFKVASGQLTEWPFLTYMARKGKPMIISTGMSTLEDVRGAVQAVRQGGNEEFILLQCTTNYPSQLEDAHLRVIETLKNEFHVPVGYSDHTVGSLAILGAVALGASVIEKHFTLDRHMPGPDHSSSIEPKELSQLVQQIRDLEKALGNRDKMLSPIEIKNAAAMKRSLVSAQFIARGTRFALPMLTFKRPATGISPQHMEKIIGKEALCDIPPDTIVTYEMVKR
ncbi:MAG: N-acetylneuraminate synthase [Elusimicrobia bacterium]|nr:N-acetylneuraminate synthase [Candidatus Obscuribacterium magneticum]